jgi:protein DGCR14
MPVVDNYSLLPKDPSPSPQDLPSLLTWGTLLATPKALDGSDDPLDTSRPSFKLPETKRRDEIGRKLGDKASRSMNARAQSYTPRLNASGLGAALRSAADKSARGTGFGKVEKTPGRGGMLPPSSTPRRTDALTPAARQLLKRSMGVSTSPGLGRLSTGARNRSSAMETNSNWSGLRKDPGEKSWTPSPHRK